MCGCDNSHSIANTSSLIATDNEIRFWKDYINGATYMYDDKKKKGGLKNGERFVIIGDQNCDPVDGDAALKPINSLLDDPLTDTSITPTSVGAEKYIPEAKPDYSNPETKTGKFIHQYLVILDETSTHHLCYLLVCCSSLVHLLLISSLGTAC